MQVNSTADCDETDNFFARQCAFSCIAGHKIPFLPNKENNSVFNVRGQSSAISASTSDSLVAQLVAKRTAVCESSTFSQKLTTTCF